MKKLSGPEQVAAYMATFEHPFKAEIAAVREIILAANPKLQERIKWNAPSFYFDKDFAAFNPRQQAFAQLVIVFHDGAMIADRMGLLEGDYKDRRLAHFHSMEDVLAKKAALETVVNAWVALVEGSTGSGQ